MKVLTINDRLVLPFLTAANVWTFATPHAHEDLGATAVVTDLPDASPRLLARAELGPIRDSEVDPEQLDTLAAFIIRELAWMQRVPVGSPVRIRRAGSMSATVSAAHLDYHRAESKVWARKARREGFLPLLLTRGDRVSVLAIPWKGPRAVVDIDEVRRLLPQYGRRVVDHLEVL